MAFLDRYRSPFPCPSVKKKKLITPYVALSVFSHSPTNERGVFRSLDSSPNPSFLFPSRGKA